MSTVEDFKNAPGGAIATNPYGGRAMKIYVGAWHWTTFRGNRLNDTEMELQRYTLDPAPAPTTAHEALDLAWNLAHPVKEGQYIPKGTRYVRHYQDGSLATFTATEGLTPTPRPAEYLCTMEPLPEPEPEPEPDPEPDWLDAPAVIAWSRWDDVRRVKIWSEDDGHYKSTDGVITNWQDLRDVTPLYPKGQEA